MTAFKKRRICGASYGTLQSAFAYFFDNLPGFVSISEKKKKIGQPNQYTYVINTSFGLLRLITGLFSACNIYE